MFACSRSGNLQRSCEKMAVKVIRKWTCASSAPNDRIRRVLRSVRRARRPGCSHVKRGIPVSSSSARLILRAAEHQISSCSGLRPRHCCVSGAEAAARDVRRRFCSSGPMQPGLKLFELTAATASATVALLRSHAYGRRTHGSSYVWASLVSG